jgi:hypothetical protein
MVLGLLAKPLALIQAYWIPIVIVVGIFFAYNAGYDYLLPEYCMTDTTENRESLTAYGVTISQSNGGSDSICFRSRDTELVRQIFDNMQDRRLAAELELQLTKEANRNALLNRLLEPQLFYPILILIAFLGVAFINSKKKYHN